MQTAQPEKRALLASLVAVAALPLQANQVLALGGAKTVTLLFHFFLCLSNFFIGQSWPAYISLTKALTTFHVFVDFCGWSYW